MYLVVGTMNHVHFYVKEIRERVVCMRVCMNEMRLEILFVIWNYANSNDLKSVYYGPKMFAGYLILIGVCRNVLVIYYPCEKQC